MLTGTVLYLLSVTVLLSTLELLRYHEPHTFSCALLFWLTTSVSLLFARLSLASVVSHVRRALSRGFGPFFFALPILVSTRSSYRRQPYPALSKKGWGEARPRTEHITPQRHLPVHTRQEHLIPNVRGGCLSVLADCITATLLCQEVLLASPDWACQCGGLVALSS
jgi:hypothetical protein